MEEKRERVITIFEKVVPKLEDTDLERLEAFGVGLGFAVGMDVRKQLPPSGSPTVPDNGSARAVS